MAALKKAEVSGQGRACGGAPPPPLAPPGAATCAARIATCRRPVGTQLSANDCWHEGRRKARPGATSAVCDGRRRCAALSLQGQGSYTGRQQLGVDSPRLLRGCCATRAGHMGDAIWPQGRYVLATGEIRSSHKVDTIWPQGRCGLQRACVPRAPHARQAGKACGRRTWQGRPRERLGCRSRWKVGGRVGSRVGCLVRIGGWDESDFCSSVDVVREAHCSASSRSSSPGVSETGPPGPWLAQRSEVARCAAHTSSERPCLPP